jgi:hypothetical protein
LSVYLPTYLTQQLRGEDSQAQEGKQNWDWLVWARAQQANTQADAKVGMGKAPERSHLSFGKLDEAS